MENPIKPTGLEIPRDIYEAALAYQLTGKDKFTDKQRLAAQAGYIAGAIAERNGYHGK